MVLNYICGSPLGPQENVRDFRAKCLYHNPTKKIGGTFWRRVLQDYFFPPLECSLCLNPWPICPLLCSASRDHAHRMPEAHQGMKDALRKRRETEETVRYGQRPSAHSEWSSFFWGGGGRRQLKPRKSKRQPSPPSQKNSITEGWAHGNFGSTTPCINECGYVLSKSEYFYFFHL